MVGNGDNLFGGGIGEDAPPLFLDRKISSTVGIGSAFGFMNDEDDAAKAKIVDVLGNNKNKLSLFSNTPLAFNNTSKVIGTEKDNNESKKDEVKPSLFGNINNGHSKSGNQELAEKTKNPSIFAFGANSGNDKKNIEENKEEKAGLFGGIITSSPVTKPSEVNFQLGGLFGGNPEKK